MQHLLLTAHIATIFSLLFGGLQSVKKTHTVNNLRLCVTSLNVSPGCVIHPPHTLEEISILDREKVLGYSRSNMEIDCGNKVLGKGGYATVFEGVWGVNRRPVAVKRVFLHAEGTRLEEEALRRLDHPNVVKLFHAESGIVLRFFALELCQASLERLFLKDGDPKKYCGPMPSSLQVLHQLATGLEYIHKMKLIHRDLKPENVLIWVDSKTDNVLMKWSGFGLCEQVDESGSYAITEIKGTLNYLAPEILKIKILKDNGQRNISDLQRATLKSDVFGEGLVFGYFLSQGKHPFGYEHPEIQSNIINQNPINVEKIEPKCNQDLILKMLADEAESRISSWDVVNYLENLQNQMNGRE